MTWFPMRAGGMRGFKESKGGVTFAFKRACNQISITYRGYQSHKWGYNECDNIKR